MRIVVTTRDAGSTERVTLLDWQFDGRNAAQYEIPADTGEAADAWARHAAAANGFGGAEANASQYQDETAPKASTAKWPRAATA